MIDTDEERRHIEAALRAALRFERTDTTTPAVTPHGDGHAARRIVELIKVFDPAAMTTKGFFDISFSVGG